MRQKKNKKKRIVSGTKRFNLKITENRKCWCLQFNWCKALITCLKIRLSSYSSRRIENTLTLSLDRSFQPSQSVPKYTKMWSISTYRSNRLSRGKQKNRLIIKWHKCNKAVLVRKIMYKPKELGKLPKWITYNVIILRIVYVVSLVSWYQYNNNVTEIRIRQCGGGSRNIGGINSLRCYI